MSEGFHAKYHMIEFSLAQAILDVKSCDRKLEEEYFEKLRSFSRNVINLSTFVFELFDFDFLYLFEPPTENLFFF